MTEAEWLACDEPAPMLLVLRGNTSDRKFWLFAAACCRRIWSLLGERGRAAVALAEAAADGDPPGGSLDAALELPWQTDCGRDPSAMAAILCACVNAVDPGMAAWGVIRPIHWV